MVKKAVLLDKEDALELLKESELIHGTYTGTNVRTGNNEDYGEFILLDGPHSQVMVLFDQN